MVMDGPEAQNCLFIGLFRRNAVPARQWDNITPLFYYNKPLADDDDGSSAVDIRPYEIIGVERTSENVFGVFSGE